LRVLADTAHPGYLILRRRSYPAWRVTVNGSVVPALPQREDGLMAVPVPQGRIDLTIDWTTTTDAFIGRWLSGLALIMLAALYFTEHKPSQIRFSSQPRLS
jgi:hypothetical protein